MRSNDQFIAVLDLKKRILRIHWLFAKNIKACTCNGAFGKSGVQIWLIYNGASRKIQENSGFLHLTEFFQCHQVLRVPIQWCMDGKNIRVGKKLIQAYLFIFCIVFLPGSGVANNMAAKCLGNLRHPVSNCAKTDNSPGFSIQLEEILSEMGETGSSCIFSGFYVIVVIIQFFQNIEKKSEGMLCHSVCRVSGNIVSCNSPLFQIVSIQVVKACCGQADQLQVLCFSNGRLADWNLVGHDHICVFCLFFHFICCCTSIYYYFAQCLKWSKYHILSQAVCFQNYNFHNVLLAFFCAHLYSRAFPHLFYKIPFSPGKCNPKL